MCAWLETGLHGCMDRLKIDVPGSFCFRLERGRTGGRTKSQQDEDSGYSIVLVILLSFLSRYHAGFNVDASASVFSVSHLTTFKSSTAML
jgi:hypothetical protein